MRHDERRRSRPLHRGERRQWLISHSSSCLGRRQPPAAAVLDRLRAVPENADVPRFHLSLGSNIGDRERSLGEAAGRLREAGLPVDRVSSLWETEPVGEAAGPAWFLNAAVSGDTELDPEQILEICRSVESAMGRERTVAGGPRVIDIDLLMLGEMSVSRPGCVVPHPRMHERRFVLEPLREIAPDAVHPVLGLTVEQLLERVDDPHRTRSRGPLAPAFTAERH
jgi:2-amino-4-hydroxy-6-hydroxymethyldihydropteridine diphosphokinase